MTTHDHAKSDHANDNDRRGQWKCNIILRRVDNHQNSKWCWPKQCWKNGNGNINNDIVKHTQKFNNLNTIHNTHPQDSFIWSFVAFQGWPPVRNCIMKIVGPLFENNYMCIICIYQVIISHNVRTVTSCTFLTLSNFCRMYYFASYQFPQIGKVRFIDKNEMNKTHNVL